MEFPLQPDDWTVLEAATFNNAEARDPGVLGFELLVQVRGNGRMQDHSRIAIGGSQQLDVPILFSEVYSDPGPLSGATLRYQVWPRDIEIRRNMTTTAWMDVRALIERRDVIVEDAEGSFITADEACKMLDRVDKKREQGGCIRWAVVVAYDQRLRLDCQSLPGRGEVVSGKPILSG
jgi:hypothetical protein